MQSDLLSKQLVFTFANKIMKKQEKNQRLNNTKNRNKNEVGEFKLKTKEKMKSGNQNKQT
jgi:hypothetical protein